MKWNIVLYSVNVNAINNATQAHFLQMNVHDTFCSQRMDMGYEIEFFPVGDASKAGDAISVRFGSNGNYRVIIIDGGTDDAGETIVNHVREVYGVNTIVSDVISTHPDSDHACGLRTVLQELPVERLWVHGLWHHASEILNLFENANWTVQGLSKAIKDEYPVIGELFDIAAKYNIPVYEPFAGANIGPFTVLSPNKATYQHLIPQFRKTPAPNSDLLKARSIWLATQKNSLFSQFLTKASDTVADWISESWNIELLREGGVTAAENESSVVLFGDFEGRKVLLTADSGVNALNWACDNATGLGLDVSGTEFIQVPHHGSRRNVSPSTLDRIIGPKLPLGTAITKSAAV